MNKLKLRDIKKSFGSTNVIHGIDLDVNVGEFIVFVGPSGCGKSTMLRMIAGLETITDGELIIHDKVMNDEPPAKRKVAMVFQSYALYPNMSFGLEQAKLPKREIRKKVDATAATLKLEELMDRLPSELSGGQSQRVAIGRAIVRDPELFLFDEPLSNLDAELRVHMRVEIKALHKRLKRTMIYVTHDQVEAMTMADRIVVFNQGRIEQVGTPLELYNQPVNQFVAGFIGSPKMNFIDVNQIQKQSESRLLSNLVAGVPNDEPMILGVRPEHLKLCDDSEALITGTVLHIEHLGGESFIYTSVGEAIESLTAKVDGQPDIHAGDTIFLTASTHHVYFFNKYTGKTVLNKEMAGDYFTAPVKTKNDMNYVV